MIVAIFLVFFAAPLEAEGSMEKAGQVTQAGFVTFGLALVGIVGAALVYRAERLAAGLALVAAVGGVVACRWFWIVWIPPGAFFVLAAVAAFVAGERARSGTTGA